MVWDKLAAGTGKVAGFNHWPNPVNWIIDVRTLMCNDDYWLADIEFAAATFATFFFTQFIPSPRELERKIGIGGYRCGFFLSDGFANPVEIIWGRDTARVLVEIAHPFLTGLFYIWAMEVGIGALAAWQTVMFKQLRCAPFVGNYLYSGAHAGASGGHSEGSVGLGTLVYDPNHYGNATVADMNVGAGWTRMNVYWTFISSGNGFTDIKTGFLIGDTVIDIQDHGSLPPGGTRTVVRDLQYDDTSGHDIAPWWSADCPLTVIPNTVSAVRVIGDHHDIEPDYPHPPNTVVRGRHRPRPMCALDVVPV